MKALRYIFMLGYILGVGMSLSSCDVHEFPEPRPTEISFKLHLNYDTALPLYKVISYDSSSRSVDAVDVDIRYIVSVYSAEEQNTASERNELYRFVFSKDDISELNHSVELMLESGAYNFVVWSDYIQNSTNDLYYQTSTFERIKLRGNEHEGSNDYRDAFTGTVTAEVSAKSRETTVAMGRPMAKFNFISTDVDEFIEMMQTIREKKTGKNSDNSGRASDISIQLSDFDVVFRYNGYMPNTFNAYTNKPSDSTTDVSFKSKLGLTEDGEAELGFDYIFVNGSESVINISVEVYDYDGDLVSRFKPVDVPLIRSHLTTIKANFLTSNDGGVDIDPGYDGDFNITIE